MNGRNRRGRYCAVYLVNSWTEAAGLTAQMHEGTASSFGDGEEQWEGIDLTDPGARMSMRLDMGGRVRVEVTIPVDVVPPGYWLSPFAVEGIMTWDLGGFNMHGEAMWWGMLFGRETCPL